MFSAFKLAALHLDVAMPLVLELLLSAPQENGQLNKFNILGGQKLAQLHIISLIRWRRVPIGERTVDLGEWVTASYHSVRENRSAYGLLQNYQDPIKIVKIERSKLFVWKSSVTCST